MASSESRSYPYGYRLPVIDKDASVLSLPHLSNEEKILGLENLHKIPPSDGWYLLGSDPELQAFLSIMEKGILRLLQSDSQFNPGSPMSLSCLQIAKNSRFEWMATVMSHISVKGIELWKKEDFSPENLGLLDFSNSGLWTEEQRLTLEFTKACQKNTMTDELYEQAKDAWGEKGILRLMMWFGFVRIWAILQDIMKVRFEPGTIPEEGVSPEMVESFKPDLDAFWKALMEVWSTTSIPEP